MKTYNDKYKKYKSKYLKLKAKELHIIYDFHFVNNELIIKISSNKNIKYFLGEQWCTENINDKIIIQKTKNIIEYKISKDIPEYQDDKLYCYPMVRQNYACFTGVIGLYLPQIANDFIEFQTTFKTNFPLFISGLGHIKESKTVKTNIHYLKNQLFVFTKDYITKGSVTLTYKYDAYFFVDKNEIISQVSKFIDKCYEFFGLKRDVEFLVNYNGFLSKNNTNIGFGGNGNYAGFNYLVTESKKTEELANKITIYLMHELFHHFNKSSDYKANWFGEGFTEFFCRYLYLDKKEFVKECNKFLEQYWLNPYRNSKIDIMTRENFWNNKFIEKLPYVKGFVYCIYLLQKYGNEFMDIYKSIIKDLYNDNKMQITNDLLKERFHDDNFDKYIIKGELIDIDGQFEKNVKGIYLGFDMDSLINSKIIKNIDKKSDAYKLGIRNGEIEELHINMNEGTIVVIQNDKKININILKGENIIVPQLHFFNFN